MLGMDIHELAGLAERLATLVSEQPELEVITRRVDEPTVLAHAVELLD